MNAFTRRDRAGGQAAVGAYDLVVLVATIRREPEAAGEPEAGRALRGARSVVDAVRCDVRAARTLSPA